MDEREAFALGWHASKPVMSKAMTDLLGEEPAALQFMAGATMRLIWAIIYNTDKESAKAFRETTMGEFCEKYKGWVREN